MGQLLHAPDETARAAAWEELIARHTRLLLAVARSFGGGHDEAMERYTYVLEKLHEADYHRLRAFQTDGRASFSTWLTVAARRLCLDHHRTRYGRSRPDRESTETAPLRAIRRRLADSLGVDFDTDLLPDSGAAAADTEAVRAERDAMLRAAVESLPPRDRLLLTLRFDDDLSVARITGILGLPTPFHVYRRLNAVLAQLRTALESRGIGDADG